MSFETTRVSVDLVNTGFVDKIFNGHIKEAQEQASLYIRRKLYEDGILRRLFGHRIVTADELDPNMNDDQPSIICELEPDAQEATFVPFKGTGNHMYFKDKRFRVPFGKVESQRVHKSKYELMTIRMPITDWLKENQVKAIQNEEDTVFMNLCQDIITKNPGQLISYTMATGDFKDLFTKAGQLMSDLELPMGKCLMRDSTFWESLKLKTDDIGFKPQEDRFNRGVEGESSFMGVPVIRTIKHIIPKDEVWFFTQQDYFCKFFLLDDCSLFMKTEADMIEFYTYEAPGMAIGNTRGVIKVKLV